MDVILIILGVLGVGAVGISVYVFTVAARDYVSAEHRNNRNKSSTRTAQQWVERSPTDRRSGKPVTFPLTVNGTLILEDRRKGTDRRKLFAA